jgi:hypothetical protein
VVVLLVEELAGLDEVDEDVMVEEREEEDELDDEAWPVELEREEELAAGAAAEPPFGAPCCVVRLELTEVVTLDAEDPDDDDDGELLTEEVVVDLDEAEDDEGELLLLLLLPLDEDDEPAVVEDDEGRVETVVLLPLVEVDVLPAVLLRSWNSNVSGVINWFRTIPLGETTVGEPRAIVTSQTPP